MTDQVPEASHYFEAQYRRYADPKLLDYAAQLAGYTGDDARALTLYEERANTKPFSLEAATRAVIYLIRKDRLRDAFSDLPRDDRTRPLNEKRLGAQINHHIAQLGNFLQLGLVIGSQRHAVNLFLRLVFCWLYITCCIMR